MKEDQELYSKEGNLNNEAKSAFKRKKKELSRHPMTDKVAAMYNRYNGDLNRIAASLMIPKTLVEEILKNENI